MKLLKHYEYHAIMPEPFAIPLPVYFELYYDDLKLATYRIADELWIDYTYDNSYGISVITPEKDVISMSDIYFLFTCRVFERTFPYAAQELNILGLKDYNPFNIAKKTHGLMQNDKYWIRFPDFDDIDSYPKALEHFNKLHEKD